MRTRGCSLADAWALVQERRPCVLPNNTFFTSLVALEQRLRQPERPSMVEADYAAYVAAFRLCFFFV